MINNGPTLLYYLIYLYLQKYMAPAARCTVQLGMCHNPNT